MRSKRNKKLAQAKRENVKKAMRILKNSKKLGFEFKGDYTLSLYRGWDMRLHHGNCPNRGNLSIFSKEVKLGRLSLTRRWCECILSTSLNRYADYYSFYEVLNVLRRFNHYKNWNAQDVINKETDFETKMRLLHDLCSMHEVNSEQEYSPPLIKRKSFYKVTGKEPTQIYRDLVALSEDLALNHRQEVIDSFGESDQSVIFVINQRPATSKRFYDLSHSDERVQIAAARHRDGALISEILIADALKERKAGAPRCWVIGTEGMRKRAYDVELRNLGPILTSTNKISTEKMADIVLFGKLHAVDDSKTDVEVLNQAINTINHL